MINQTRFFSLSLQTTKPDQTSLGTLPRPYSFHIYIVTLELGFRFHLPETNIVSDAPGPVSVLGLMDPAVGYAFPSSSTMYLGSVSLCSAWMNIKLFTLSFLLLLIVLEILVLPFLPGIATAILAVTLTLPCPFCDFFSGFELFKSKVM